MQVIPVSQGSSEWLAVRATHLCASEAAAMLGFDKATTRTQLLQLKHTGLGKEFSEWVQTNLLDKGHEIEAATRPIGEEIIGEELYPCIGTIEVDGLRLLASFDGMTMCEDVVWECKSRNASLIAAMADGDLPDTHWPQVEQQLMISNADKALFTCGDGTAEHTDHLWYQSRPERRAKIVAGWHQFAKDLANYKQVEIVEKPKAEAIMQLPAVVINVHGELALCNLGDVTPKFDAFLSGANIDLKTDDDFANGEATARFSRSTAKTLKLKAKEVIGQIATVSEAVCTLELYADKFDALGLKLEKAVTGQKETIKTNILNAAKLAFTEHVASLEAEIKPIRLVHAQPDFVGAMKNKRTLASLHDAVDTELANAKINTDAIAKGVRTRMGWCKTNAEGFGFLFADLQSIIYKADDDFHLIVTTRVDAHKKAETDKIEAERAKIRADEEAKATAKAAEDTRRQVAEAQAKAEAEAKEKADADAKVLREAEQAHAAAPVQAPAQESIAPAIAATPPPVRAPESYQFPARSTESSHTSAESSVLVNLGSINAALGFTVTADFLGRLGFDAVQQKNAKLYRDSDFQRICAAIVRHVQIAAATPLKSAA